MSLNLSPSESDVLGGIRAHLSQRMATESMNDLDRIMLLLDLLVRGLDR